MPYWITDTLAGVPAFLWIYAGLGGVWSLAVLPRVEWQRRVQVVAVAFALGPALLTAWMFILGTVGGATQTPLLNWGNVLGGTAALAVVALALVWRKWRQPPPVLPKGQPLLNDERLLLALVVAGLAVSWVVVAYWPFTAYDTLWVYGFEGRLYALLGYIPQTIGYYPQFLPLQYAFAQLGGINDHTARAVLLFLHVGSILATYVLGSRLFNRRVGIIAAAMWALYPHVGEWSRAGDLEIPLAFLFTLAAAFFLLAWVKADTKPKARRYSLLAGVMLGIGMWTKPTMGAFLLGMALLLLIELARVGFDWRRWWLRGQLALLTSIVAAPLGGVWYIRNMLLGHSPLVFPPGYWLTFAQRSGQEFGWVLLALLIWVLYLVWRYPRYNWRLSGLGVGLVALALVPSILSPRRMTVIEFALLGAGMVALGITVRRMMRDLWDDDLRETAAKLGWAVALGLPYFVTWFYAYSYHFRLSFAVVPLLILPTAVILAHIFTRERVGSIAVNSGVRRLAYFGLICIVAVPGIISPISDLNGGGDYLWTGKYPDDTARYRSGNEALMTVVDGLQVWLDDHPGERLVVSAPEVNRLPFFFPLEDIRVEALPTRLDQIADAAYFVYGTPESAGEYQSVPPRGNQVIGALNRNDIMRRAWGADDGIFRYDVYELHLSNRWVKPEINGAAGEDVTFGDFVRYLGYDIGGLELWPGRRMIMHLYWEVLKTPSEDYTIYIHLRDTNGNVIASWDDPIARGEHGYYSSLVWQPGEIISDERTISLPDGVAPVGEDYRIVIGIYGGTDNARVPITVDGVAGGDGYTLQNPIAIIGEEPS